MQSAERFPIGGSVTPGHLSRSPYDTLAELRQHEPVSWIPAMNAWFVTRRDLAVAAMSDPDRFTVADDRFTTAQVLGPSMLSIDGPEHRRHRDAFAPTFRPKFVREQFVDGISQRARRLAATTLDGERELRSGIAAPLAVETILEIIGLPDVDSSDVLAWYGAFGEAIEALTVGNAPPDHIEAHLATLTDHLRNAITGDEPSLVRQLVDDAVLQPDEIPAAIAVVMFGAIETSEAMTTNALRHLFTNPESLDRLRGDRELIAPAIEESIRLEPAAAVVDRYTTSDVELGGVTIPAGELVTISLLGANRDPSVFEHPDRFDIDRPNLAQHVTWAVGPHTCIGLHVAKAETHASISALLDYENELGTRFVLDLQRSPAPTGLIFRKPHAVTVALGA